MWTDDQPSTDWNDEALYDEADGPPLLRRRRMPGEWDDPLTDGVLVRASLYQQVVANIEWAQRKKRAGEAARKVRHKRRKPLAPQPELERWQPEPRRWQPQTEEQHTASLQLFATIRALSEVGMSDERIAVALNVPEWVVYDAVHHLALIDQPLGIVPSELEPTR